MTELPDWRWRVIVYLEERDTKQILASRASHRAGAKQDVYDRVTTHAGTITDWGDVYIPRPSWDCPECGTHEALNKLPNLRDDHDWECFVCGLRAYGEPMDWDQLDRQTVF